MLYVGYISIKLGVGETEGKKIESMEAGTNFFVHTSVAEEKHLVCGFHLYFLIEFTQGACGGLLEDRAGMVQPTSAPFPSNGEVLTGSVIPILVFIGTYGSIGGWGAGVGLGRGGSEGSINLKPTGVFKTSFYRLRESD